MLNTFSIGAPPGRLPWIMLIVGCLGLGALMGYDIYIDYQETTDYESRRLQQQADMVQSHLVRYLETTAQALRTVGKDVQRQTASPHGPSHAHLNTYLHSMAEGMTGVESLTVFDGPGKQRFSSAPEDPLLARLEAAGLAPEDRVPAATVLPGLFLGRPTQAVATEAHRLHFAQALPSSATQPSNGWLVAKADSDYLRLLLETALYAPDMRAGLVHGNGQLFLRVPDLERVTGVNLGQQPQSFVAQHVASGRLANFSQGPVASTGERKMVALRTVLPGRAWVDRPWVVFLSRDLDVVYDHWEKNLRVRLELLAAIVTVTGFSLWLIQRRQGMHRQRLAQEAQERAHIERELAQQQAGLRWVEAELRHNQVRFSHLLEDLRQAVLLFRNGHCIAANRSALALLRCQNSTVVQGSRWLDWSARQQPDGRDSAQKLADMAWISQALGSHVFEWACVRANGEPFLARLLWNVSREECSEWTQITVHDLGPQHMLRQEIEYLALHDPVTTLPNMTLGRQQLQHALDTPSLSQPGLAVVQIRLHRLSAINQNHGEQVANHLLLGLAVRLGSALRPQDLLSRRSGNGFMVILTGIHRYAEIAAQCDRLLEVGQTRFGVEGMPLGCPLVLGVSLSPQDSTDAETLLRQADLAQREAHRNGPNSCCFFTPAMAVAEEETQGMREDLYRAWEKRRFSLRYAARTRLAGGTPLGWEAQVCWQPEGHPRAEVLSRELWQTVTEGALITPLGRWLLQEACVSLATQWPNTVNGEVGYVSVPISDLQYRSGQLEHEVMAALQASGLAATRLELCLPASVLREEHRPGVEMMQRLAACGVRWCLVADHTWCLDGFYLQQLPIRKWRWSWQGQSPTRLECLLQEGRRLGLQTCVADLSSLPADWDTEAWADAEKQG